MQWFVREFSEGFSGGDLLSLAVLVLLAFALWTRRPQSNVLQAIFALKEEVNQIKGAVNTLVTVLVPQDDAQSPLPKKGNMPPPKNDK